MDQNFIARHQLPSFAPEPGSTESATLNSSVAIDYTLIRVAVRMLSQTWISDLDKLGGTARAPLAQPLEF
jgi:hypothetical protein